MDEKFITDELLFKHAPNAERLLLQSIPAEQEVSHTFSDAFERKMRKLVHRNSYSPQWHPYFRIRKRAIISLATVLIILITLAVGAQAWRPKFFDFFIRIFEKYSTVGLQTVSEPVYGTEIFLEYEPSYIPDGFVLNRTRASDTSKSMQYKNTHGDTISYLQIKIEQANFDINTEKAKIETFTLKGELFYYVSNQGIQTIWWSDDLYSYKISSVLDKNQLIKIAESLKLKK